MYNLFVSANEDAWNGDPFVIERSRCVLEDGYTVAEIAGRFAELNSPQLQELCELPCVFAYEKDCAQNPKFGTLRRVKRRTRGLLQIEYRLISCVPFATIDDLQSLGVQLDIGRWELNRTHWAVKDVDLAAELGRSGIVLPRLARAAGTIDIRRHSFEVALSFPGEHRSYVERIADELEQELGPNACFYDRYYEAQLAQPSLDALLHGIYGKRSGLVVAFICREYDEKKWCGIEWKKIRERVVTGDAWEVMYVRLGEGDVAGMTRLDGYIDARERPPEELARLIFQRVQVAKHARREG